MCKNMNSRENYTLKIGICDDDLDCVISVVKLIESEIIEQNLNAEITIITDNQKEIFDAIYYHKIDILFLDIDFKNKGKNGLDFASDLRNINKNFFLIFLSAHQRYMHVSFYVKVYDYLVKPANRYVIQELISRLKSEFTHNRNLFLNINKWVSIRIDDILYIERTKNKSKIVTSFDIYDTSKSLEILLNDLPDNFRKCHRSFVLNENKVISIDRKTQYAYFTKNNRCPINSYFELS